MDYLSTKIKLLESKVESLESEKDALHSYYQNLIEGLESNHQVELASINSGIQRKPSCKRVPELKLTVIEQVNVAKMIFQVSFKCDIEKVCVSLNSFGYSSYVLTSKFVSVEGGTVAVSLEKRIRSTTCIEMFIYLQVKAS